MTQNCSNKNLIANKPNKLPIDLLKSGQLLSTTKNQSSGLIIQKPYYAEFVGPGSAVGGMFDVQCKTLFVIGNVEFEVPSTQAERKQAFQSRIADIEALQDVCQHDAPLQRAVSLLQFLGERFPLEEIQMISNDVLAHLAGVLPSTIALAWQYQSQRAAGRTFDPVTVQKSTMVGANH